MATAGSRRRALIAAVVATGALTRAQASNRCGLDELGARLERPVAATTTKTSISRALEVVTERSGLAILADGEPEPLPTDLHLRGTAREALDQIGERFDCAWSTSRGGVVLLHRRFRRAGDRPQMHAAEMRQVARDLAALADRIPHGSSDHDWGWDLVDLSRTFTPEQWRTLNGGQRLRAAALSPAQQGLLWRAVATRVFAFPGTARRELAAKLDALDQSSLRYVDAGASSQDARGLIAYHCVHVARTNLGRLETPLGIVRVKARAEARPQTVALGQGGGPGERQAPAAGAEGAPGKSQGLDTPVTLPAAGMTLEALCRSLADQTGVVVAAAEHLRDRRLVVSVKGRPARTILDALCELNDWTWTRSAGRVRVARRVPRAPAEPAAVAAAMRAALPRDLRHFLGIQALPGAAEPPRFDISAATRLADSAGQSVALSAHPLAGPEGAVPVRKLTAGQKEELVAVLAMRLFRDADTPLWSGDKGFHQMAADTTWLEVPRAQGSGQGEVLTVLHVDSEGGSIGFGQNIVRPALRPRSTTGQPRSGQ